MKMIKNNSETCYTKIVFIFKFAKINGVLIMNLKNVLIIVGVIALILLIIQYVGQVRRMAPRQTTLLAAGEHLLTGCCYSLLLGVSVVLSMLITTQSRILI